MTEQTELPWKGPLSLRDCKERNIIDDADGNALFLIVGLTVQSRGNRKRVGDALVGACNSHEKLLEACEEYIRAVDGITLGILDRKALATHHIRQAISSIDKANKENQP